MLKKIPVTILTGFLGSGKTTLVNHILENRQGLKAAVIENEFGAVSIDDALIKDRKVSCGEEIIEMMNGCICCTVRADLIVTIKKLLSQQRNLDCIIIETTGLADPAPVAQTFFVEPEIGKLCTLDAILTVVDAKHILQQLDSVRPEGVENEAEEQVAFADRIVLNKTDLVTEEELSLVTARLRQLNPYAEILPTTKSAINPAKLLNIGGFNLERVMAMDPEFLDTNAEHKHDTSIKSLSIVSPDPVNVFRLQNFISSLVGDQGQDLLRYKGVFNVKGFDERYVFQGVHMLYMGNFMKPWGDKERRMNKFVFIGRNLDVEALQIAFADCRAETSLRFAPGATAFCNVEGGFKEGKVLRHWDEGNAYRVRLADGTEVWAPIDEDGFIRCPPPAYLPQVGEVGATKSDVLSPSN
jgi:G3E family GTPase